MRFVDVRAEGDHVESGVGDGDDAAFEAGVAGADFDVVAEEVAVERFHLLQDGRFGAGAPAGIAGVLADLCVDQLKRRGKGGGDILILPERPSCAEGRSIRRGLRRVR